MASRAAAVPLPYPPTIVISAASMFIVGLSTCLQPLELSSEFAPRYGRVALGFSWRFRPCHRLTDSKKKYVYR